MKYVRYSFSNGYPSCHVEDVEVYHDDFEDIDGDIYDMFLDFCDEYEWVARGWNEDWESDDDREVYLENCSYHWEYISKEEYEEEVSG